MKKTIITLALAIISLCACAQLQRNGNTFSAQTCERTQKKAKCDTLDAQWQANDSTYQLYMGTKGGIFYIKNGKRHYLKKAHAEELKQALAVKKED